MESQGKYQVQSHLLFRLNQTTITATFASPVVVIGRTE